MQIEPKPADRMIVGGARFKVEMVEGVQPSGVPLMWKVYLSGPKGEATVSPFTTEFSGEFG